MKTFLIPRFRDILFLGIFAAALILGPRMLNQDGDLPRHMAIGRYVLAGHLPPVNDIFSHTVPGAPFAPHKWLSGVLFYLAYLIFDERGMLIISAIALATTFTIIYTQTVELTKLRLPTLLLVAWGAILTSLHWIVRPHIFTMLLFAVWLVLTDKLARGEKLRLWIFPAVMFLWNNIHGEYIAGFLISAAYLGGLAWDYWRTKEKSILENGKRLGIASGLAALVTLLNPISLRAWGTVTSWLGNQYLMSHTEETLPPDFTEPKFMVLLAFMLLSIILVAQKRKALSTGQLFTLAGFSAMALLSARNIHFYGVAAPYLLAPTVTGLLAIPLVKKYEGLFADIEGRLKGAIWPCITVIMGIAMLAVTPLGQAQNFSPAVFPVQAVEWLKNHPQQGEMFNSFDWGGYLSFTLPEKKVFVDSQGDVYGEAFLRKYEQLITLAPGWQGILEEYHVRWALVPSQWPLVGALASEGWLEVYRDKTSVILVKRP